MSARVHHARLSSKRVLATDVVEYRFALAPEEAPLAWRAGQFISVTCGHTADDSPLLRSYSLANLPTPPTATSSGEVVLILKLVTGGAASEWFRKLSLGEQIRFTGPMGFFVLDPPHSGDVVFGATGTGIAPILPMIEELLARPDEHGHIELFFGVREQDDLFWHDEIAALCQRGGGRLVTHTLLSRPPLSWTGERGRITQPLLDRLPSLKRPTFYLCGNGAMIREVKAGLVERGVERKKQIRTEAFFD